MKTIKVNVSIYGENKYLLLGMRQVLSDLYAQHNLVMVYSDALILRFVSDVMIYVFMSEEELNSAVSRFSDCILKKTLFVHLSIPGVFLKDAIKDKITLCNCHDSRIFLEKFERVRINSVKNKKANFFTPQELRVIRLMAKGVTPYYISRVLKIHVKTISTHKRNIMERLNLKNNIDFSLWLLQQELSWI